MSASPNTSELETTTNAAPGHGSHGDRLRRVGAALNHDFCPSFNRYVYWLKQPLGWIICGAIISGLVGILVGSQGFVVMWTFLALLAIGSLWPWISLKAIQCEIVFDDDVSHEGEPTRATLRVSNRWPVRVFGLTVEGTFLQDVLHEDDRIVIGLKQLPSWSLSEFRWEFVPERRGKLPVACPELVTGYPFGIYQARKQVQTSNRTIVWPKCIDVPIDPELRVTFQRFDDRLVDRSGSEGDQIGVREYRIGDSFRDVHWSKSACIDQLVVRERQLPIDSSVRLVVDLSPQNHRGIGSNSTYEWAIRVAASVASRIDAIHSGVRLECYGLPIEMDYRTSNRKGIEPLMEFLAELPEFPLPDEIEQSQCKRRVLNQVKVKREEDLYLVLSPDSIQKVQGAGEGVNRFVIHETGFEFEQLRGRAARGTHHSTGSSSVPLVEWANLNGAGEVGNHVG